jgi:archaellum biogenesis protein FlaJ (TadC family)
MNEDRRNRINSSRRKLNVIYLAVSVLVIVGYVVRMFTSDDSTGEKVVETSLLVGLGALGIFVMRTERKINRH